MITKYLSLFERLFLDVRFEPTTAHNLAQGVGIVTLFVVSFFLFFVVKQLLKRFVGRWIRKSKTRFDDYLLGKKLERRIAFLIPIYMIKGLLYEVAPDLDTITSFIIVWTRVGEVTTYTGIILSLLDTMSDMYNSFDVSKTSL